MGECVHEHFIAQQQCHKNSANLFLDGEVDSFVTAFGLHRDGTRYAHSWGIKNEDEVVETVGERFVKYIGAVHTGEEGIERAAGLLKTVTREGL